MQNITSFPKHIFGINQLATGCMRRLRQIDSLSPTQQLHIIKKVLENIEIRSILNILTTLHLTWYFLRSFTLQTD